MPIPAFNQSGGVSVALLISNTPAFCNQEAAIRIEHKQKTSAGNRRVGLITRTSREHRRTLGSAYDLRKYKRLNRCSRQSDEAITYAWPTFSQPFFGLAALVHPGVHLSPIMALMRSTNLMACATSSGICMLLSIPSYRAAM